MEKEEEEAEKDILALIRKKTRRGDQAEIDQDASRKRRKKERAKKVKHEQGRQLVNKVAGGREKNMAAVETELPVMSSMDVPEAMMGSPIDVNEIGEPSERQGEVIDQRPYGTEWTIYPGKQLTRSLVCAEWVAQALPPAEIAKY